MEDSIDIEILDSNIKENIKFSPIESDNKSNVRVSTLELNEFSDLKNMCSYNQSIYKLENPLDPKIQPSLAGLESPLIGETSKTLYR